MKTKTQHPRGISYEPADRVFWANSFGLSEYQLGSSSLSSQHWPGCSSLRSLPFSVQNHTPHLPPLRECCRPGTGEALCLFLFLFASLQPWHCFPPTELSYHLVKVITLGRPTVAGGKQPAERWMKKMILTIWVRQWDRSGRASRSR